MPRFGALLALLAILVSACAHSPRSFRLVEAGPNAILVPPGVKDASVVTASVPITLRRGKPACPPSPGGLQIRGKSLVVTRDALAATTPEELRAWTAALETTGCIGSGESFRLTAALIDALPLQLSRRGTLRGEGLSPHPKDGAAAGRAGAESPCCPAPHRPGGESLLSASATAAEQKQFRRKPSD